MKDYIVRASAANAQIRAFAAVTTELTEEARKRHETSPVATAALGRLLTGGAMMGSMMKNDTDMLTIQIKCSGPIGGLTVTADSKGNVKGYVHEPNVILPPKNGKLDVGGALGQGVMTVIKDMGLKEAVQTSNVEAFKVMAVKIGNERMQRSLTLFDYGNYRIGSDVTSFWLDGTLQISALEQINFLEKLLNGQLPCSKAAQKEVENILKLEANDKYVLYGKTGLSSGPNQIGWFVGFIRKESQTYIFALNIDMNENTPYALRIDLVKKGIDKLDL